MLACLIIVLVYNALKFSIDGDLGLVQKWYATTVVVVTGEPHLRGGIRVVRRDCLRGCCDAELLHTLEECCRTVVVIPTELLHDDDWNELLLAVTGVCVCDNDDGAWTRRNLFILRANRDYRDKIGNSLNRGL